MKKSILILSAISLFAFTSCDDKTKEVTVEPGTEAVVDTDDVIVTDDVDATVVTTTTGDVDTPDFQNAELQEYMDAYDAYLNDYKEAMTSQDMGKIQALTAQGQELAKKQQAFGNLNESDTKKLSEYMEAKSLELQEIMKSATGQ